MEQPRIGVYVCWCGSNIAKMVDVVKVAQDLKAFPNVVVSRDYKYMCSDPGQELLINDIKENKLNRIVVAACSPRIHELTFRKALEHAGLNSYFLQMANIREQDSWVHSNRELATKKAKSLIAAAVNRVSYHEALEKRFVDIHPATLVIGAGVAGMSAALEIADAGYRVHLVEKQDIPGGMLHHIDLTFPDFESAEQLVDGLSIQVIRHPDIFLHTKTQVKEIHGYLGNFEATLIKKQQEELVSFGNIVVATGLKLFNPSVIKEYGYSTLKNVISSLQLEEMLKTGKLLTTAGKPPKNIAIIHCVGSRNNKYHSYCSRSCCSTALKYANQLRDTLPGANIFDIYSDIRAYGKGCEELYTDTSGRDIMFLMYNQDDGLPRIQKAGKNETAGLNIEMKERLSGEEITVPADMVVLMTAQEAQPDAKEVAHLVGISMCGNNFFMEKHPKLDPVATTTDGVFIVGSCQGPKNISESIVQAKAASARILACIAKGKAQVEVTTANVNEEICCGCQTCVSVCPYTAIHFDDEKKVSVVNEILCKGCGTCGSACPTGAIRCRHFTDKQILSQIEGLLKSELEDAF